jgi:DNA-binding CsgD family transcriptional regulator/GAF domain-containing protein
VLAGFAETLKRTTDLEAVVQEAVYPCVDAAGASQGLAYVVETGGQLGCPPGSATPTTRRPTWSASSAVPLCSTGSSGACYVGSWSIDRDDLEGPMARSAARARDVNQTERGLGRAPGRASGAARSITTCDVLNDPRVRLTPDVRKLLERVRQRSALVIPLRAGTGAASGALVVADRRQRRLPSAEIRVAQALASAAVAALQASREQQAVRRALRTLATQRRQLRARLAATRERLRELSREVAQVRGVERESAAPEGYDEVVRLLTRLKLTVEAARIEAADRSRLARAAALLDELIDEVLTAAPNRQPTCPHEAADNGHSSTPPDRARLETVDAYDTLTEREREVLQRAAEGHTCPSIAARLAISPRTVETHRAHLMRKLGLDNQTNLVRYALGRGVLPRPAPDSPLSKDAGRLGDP